MTADDGNPGTARRPGCIALIEIGRAMPVLAGRRQAAEEAEMRQEPGRPRLVVGISGASGAIYGARLLELLGPLPVETHLVMSRSAEVTLALETDLKPAELRAR